MRLPIRMLGLVAGAFLMGSALAPAAAQQNQSGVDGQVAVRSDGAVYLISNGQRRWVATVVISDEEINRYPEGEPIYVGLAPMGASSQASTGAANQPRQAATPTSGNGSGSNTANTSNTNTNRTNSSPSATPSENLDSDLPVKVDISGDETFEKGDKFTVEVTTKPDAVCELVAVFPNGKDSSEGSKNADGRGKCRYTVQIPDDSGTGEGKLIGTARDGGKVNKAELGFEVVDGDDED